jgi:NitT/TauT family transport system permease protein
MPRGAEPWGFFFSGPAKMDADNFRHLPGESGKRTFRLEVMLVPLALAAFLLFWDLLVAWQHYPTFFLPAPAQVWQRFLLLVHDGTLASHILVTLVEVLAGLTIGLVAALVLGYVLAKSALLERILSPYIVASQAVPVVAIAPLLVVWFGFGELSKVLVCALTVFFPVLITTIVGLRSVDPDLRSLMRSLQSSRWQTFSMLEVPAALPILFGALKVAVTLAVIGAVVGEFVGADRGLGFLINLARGILDTPLLFVALFVLVIIALALYTVVTMLEYVVLRWRRAE